MSNRQHICPYCDRVYRFKDLYNTHVTTCAILHRNRNDMDRSNDSYEDPPSSEEMFKIIQGLVVKVDKLENEVVQLRASAGSRKRRDIMNWLNSPANPPPLKGFQEWIEAIDVTPEHLTTVFGSTNILSGLKGALTDYCVNPSGLPVRAFTQKTNTLYVWKQVESEEGDEESEDHHWVVMDNDTYNRWYDYTKHQFVRIFAKWEMENLTLVRSTDEERNKHNGNMRKIIGCGSNTLEERRRNELRKWIYSLIATDMSQITVFE